MRAAVVRVPCSTSNLGSGFDCIGLAFQRHLQVRFAPAAGGRLQAGYGGTLAGQGGDLDTAGGSGDLLASAFLDRLAAAGVTTVAGRLTVHSEIPVARGLGSSGAATVAGIVLADAVLGREVDRPAVLALAARREGHPDNAAPALLGGLVAVARDGGGAPIAFRLPLSEDIGFVFAAPAVEIRTPEARAALPALVPHSLAARSLGRTAALLHGLAGADPEALRLGLLDELHVPHRLPLIPRAADAMAAARDAGAWGATISGSGSGLIALCPLPARTAVLEAMTRELAAGDVAVTGFVAEPDRDGARLLPAEDPC